MFKTWKDAVDNWNVLCKDEKREACDKFGVPIVACVMTRQNLLKSVNEY